MIEDDYDSEFRYDVAPVPALAALDRDRVAYLGTTSKTVAPSMRLGWLVAPPDLHRAILARREITHDAARLAGAAGVPLAAARRVRRPGRPLRAPDVRRPGRAGAPLRWTAVPSRSGPVAGMYATVPMPQADALRVAALGAGGRVRGAAAARLLPDGAPDRPDHRLRRLHRRRARPGPGRDRARARLRLTGSGRPDAARRRTPRTPRPARARSCGRGSTPCPTAARRSRRARTSSGPRTRGAIAATWITQPDGVRRLPAQQAGQQQAGDAQPEPDRDAPCATGRRPG